MLTKHFLNFKINFNLSKIYFFSSPTDRPSFFKYPAKRMASTRDKRLKTDSPTPVQSIEAPATTPTSKSSTAIKLKRMSRNRSGILSVKSENEDGNDSVGLSEDTQSSTTSADNTIVPKTPNTRTKKQKDEKDEESVGDAKEAEESPDPSKDPDTPRTRKLTKAQMLKKKGAELAQARRTAMMNRKSLPLPVKSSLRNISRRLSGGAKLGEKEESPAVVKKGKARKIVVEKKEEDEPESVQEEVEVEVPEKAEEEEKVEDVTEADTSLEVSIKQEKIEKSLTAISAIDLQNVRRSTRQRKSTIKDRDSPFTGRRSQAHDKSESKRDSISPALSTASIKAEKESSKAISITVEPSETTEKDPSLSPELVSEEMDTESVQHLYDKPDFLENNLGIEQDPKLGEIVKVQEKTKVTESVIKSDEAKLTVDDVEMEQEVEEKPKELKAKEKSEVKKSEVNGTKAEEVDDEIKKEPTEVVAKVDVKKEELGEENKENNESSAKSVGSGSPRSEDRLKTVSEENVPKLDHNESELLKQKESHLMSLGLLTHKAADEAKLAKIKHKEELAKSVASQPPGRSKSKKESSNDQQYTGTLKTIIKLNRTEKEKRKTRMPLKMTFQKKNRDRDSNGSSNSSDSFYTIQDVSFKLFSNLLSFNKLFFCLHRRTQRHQIINPVR